MEGQGQGSGRNAVRYDARAYLAAWHLKKWSVFSDIVIFTENG